MLVWYGLVPIAGALYSRYKWRRFRRQFDELRLRPLLNYGICRRLDSGGRPAPPAAFRFIGSFESITDGHTLWIQGEDLTMPVSLEGAGIWLLPMRGEDTPEAFDPGEEAPERLRWNRISTLTEGARVFVGGGLRHKDDRWRFESSKETPLMVVFYDCPDRALTSRTIRAGRLRNEYWNTVTPYSLVAGAICLLFFAYSFLNRPAFRLTAIVSFTALFIPVFPFFPPGLLFTVLYRRLAWQARILRACRDLSALPLRYLMPPGGGVRRESCRLPDGELYGGVLLDSLPRGPDETIPPLLPEFGKKKTGPRYVFGALRPTRAAPGEPADPFAVFGSLPGEPERLVRRYAIAAYALEGAAWIALLAGVALNIFFVRMILSLL